MSLHIFNKATIVLLLFFGACHAPQQAHTPTNTLGERQLWYRQPATQWLEALPVGNGRLGAMVFSNPAKERIQLNENSLWPGENDWGLADGNAKDLQEIRQLLIEGKNKQADALFVQKFLTKDIIRSHQTMGDLWIDFGTVNYKDYTRKLDLDNATIESNYTVNGTRVQQTVFASHPDEVLVIRYKADDKKGLNATVFMNRPEDDGHKTAKTFTENNSLVMQGEITQYGGKFKGKDDPITGGVKFDTRLKINHKGGSVKMGADNIVLNGVKEATIYLVCNTSYYDKNYAAKSKTQLEKVAAQTAAQLHSTHVTDYTSLAKRMQLHIEHENINLPTDERLELVKKGAIDVGLEELLFEYGRYLLISSSRNTLPTNLQGIWNDNIQAPWNADYHVNINLQMNYWPANVTNIDAVNMPLFDFIDRLVANGKEAAQKNYGCSGSFIPHATDIWATSFLRSKTAYWGGSFGAGGWLMQHYWNQYLFTKDENFLKKRAFPAMQEVAMFYHDWLIKDPKTGQWVSAPSSSPENSFINEKGESAALCLGSAKDQQVIRELFTNYLKAADILNIQNNWTQKISNKLKNLRSGTQVGSDGRLLEWDREYKEVEPGHRHVSHIYAFHPGNEITQSGTPQLVDAAKKSLDFRLANGGGRTGWSRAWLINLTARLLDGEKAHDHIQMLFKKSIVSNLFDMHPPFQIDGNFGYTAGVAEMLIQSQEAPLLRILPALPKAWKTGSATGLKARGNITADIHWKDGRVTALTLLSPLSQHVKLMVNGAEVEVRLNAGVKEKVL